MMSRPTHVQSGFTLIEMVMVMVITGIIAGIVAIFLKSPIDGYIASARRAEMTDIADTALRRIGRDVHAALPNSVRVSGSCNGTATCFVEFIPSLTGGRYRSAPASVAPTGDLLDFTAADSSFDAFVPLASAGIAAGNTIVVYNLGDAAGISAYLGNNTATVAAAPVAAANANETRITLTAPTLFPSASPAARFQVITTPVSYACDPVAGTITRWWGYSIQAAQPTATPGGASTALLASHVSNCLFAYNANVVAQRNGLMTMQLSVTESGETIALYSATHVTNVP